MYIRKFITGREFDREKTDVLLRRMPGLSLPEKIAFYAEPETRKRIYRKFMYNVEDKMPELYVFLTSSLRLPEPYDYEKSFKEDPRKFE